MQMKAYMCGMMIILTVQLNAKAGLELIVENNCEMPVTFYTDTKADDKQKTKWQLAPNSYKNIGYYYNDNVFDKHTYINIGFSDDLSQANGKLHLDIDNGWTTNSATFEDMKGPIEVERQGYQKEFLHKWHSVTNYGTPTFTISSCPELINVHQSVFKGVDRLLIFGDSLSDKGTLHEYTKGIIPKSTPYYSGMFSNGLPWSVILTKQLNQIGIDVSNYAVGGATTVAHVDTEHLPYSLGGELNAFKINKIKNGWNVKNMAAIIFIGANDYLTAPDNLTELEVNHQVSQVTSKIIEIVKELNNLGINKFIMIGLPNLGDVPESKYDTGNGEITAKLSNLHNERLKAFVESLGNKSVQIQYIDIWKLFNEMVYKTDAFNEEYKTTITDTQGSCWSGGYALSQTIKDKESTVGLLVNQNPQGEFNPEIQAVPYTPDIINAVLFGSLGVRCNSPETKVFFDRVHPTYQVHKAFYKYFLQQVGITAVKI